MFKLSVHQRHREVMEMTSIGASVCLAISGWRGWLAFKLEPHVTHHCRTGLLAQSSTALAFLCRCNTAKKCRIAFLQTKVLSKVDTRKRSDADAPEQLRPLVQTRLQPCRSLSAPNAMHNTSSTSSALRFDCSAPV